MAEKFVGTISNCAVYICRDGVNRARMVGVLPGGREPPDEIGGTPLNPFFI